MATIRNPLDILLQAAGTRLLTVTLPPSVTVSGNVTGQLNGEPINNIISPTTGDIVGNLTGDINNIPVIGLIQPVSGDFIGNVQGTLNTIPVVNLIEPIAGDFIGNVTGTLNSIPVQTVIDAANSGGGGGTDNFFTTSASDPSGGANGDAHYNSATFVMWFNIGGVWTRGGTVNASQITTGTLAAGRIAAGSITANEIAAGTITGNEIASNSITAVDIAANAITSSELAANSVIAGKIAALSITAGDIAANTITGSKIAANTITASDIAANAITTSELASNSVTAAHIQALTITGDKIATNSLTANKIAANAITASELAANSVTASKINVTTLSAIVANLGTVNAGSITGSAGINITGQAKFGGNSSFGGQFAAVHANPLNASTNGLIANSSSGTAIVGLTTSNGSGVLGDASGSGVGVSCATSGFGNALSVFGKMGISSSATVANLRSATTSNALAMGGFSPNSWARIFVGNTGTAHAAGAGMNFKVTGTLGSTVRHRGTGNFMYLENISDRRLKENIVDMGEALPMVNKMRPRTCNLKENKGNRINCFIAQELEEIQDDNVPLVLPNDKDDKDSMLGVDFNGIIAVLVKSIQELNDKIERLENG